MTSGMPSCLSQLCREAACKVRFSCEIMKSMNTSLFLRRQAWIFLAFLGVTATQAQTSQQWRDSLDVLNRQLMVNPGSVELHLRKAAVNLQLQQWEYAVDEYTDILKADSLNLSALYFRAFAHNNLRHYVLAKNDYEEILKYSPRNMEAHLGLAYTYIKMDKPADAMDQMNRAVEQNPDSAQAYAARAGLEKELRQYGPALLDWNEAVRLAPLDNDYAVSRVDILLLLGKKQAAKDALDALVRRGVPKGLLMEWYRKCR